MMQSSYYRPSFNLKEVARYGIDFELFPVYFHQCKEAFVQKLFAKGRNAMCTAYNSLSDKLIKQKPYSPSDFSVQYFQDGQDHLIYISMPNGIPGASMQCTHLAVTCHAKGPTYSDIQLYHMERSIANTTAITEINVSGRQITSRANYGEVADSDEENVRQIWAFSFPDSAFVPC